MLPAWNSERDRMSTTAKSRRPSMIQAASSAAVTPWSADDASGRTRRSGGRRIDAAAIPAAISPNTAAKRTRWRVIMARPLGSGVAELLVEDVGEREGAEGDEHDREHGHAHGQMHPVRHQHAPHAGRLVEPGEEREPEAEQDRAD